MMSVTSRCVDFGRAVLDLVACGCSSNAVLDRSSIRSYTKVNLKGSSRGDGAKQVVFGRRGRTRCGVSSMKAAETLLNRVPEGLPRVLELKKETKRPISLTNLFEVVSDDLLTLNQNLQSMAKRLKQVANAEGLQVNEIALEELSGRVNGDMRMALNQLHYMSLSMSVINYDDIRQCLNNSAKDEDISPFTAVDKLFSFNAGKLRMDERFDLSMAISATPMHSSEIYVSNACSNIPSSLLETLGNYGYGEILGSISIYDYVWNFDKWWYI